LVTWGKAALMRGQTKEAIKKLTRMRVSAFIKWQTRRKMRTRASSKADFHTQVM